METHTGSKKIALIFSMLILMFSSCDRNHISMTFDNIIVQKNPHITDDESIIFSVKVNNPTTNDVILDSEGYEKSAENSGFFLISDQFYSGAIKLTPTAGAAERKIGSGKSGKLILVLFINKLQHSLRNYNNENYTYDDLKTFLHGGNYLLIYVSFIAPETLNVPKSNTFKVIELTSQDTLNKILMP